MRFQKGRFVFKALGALCAVPMLWSNPADAAFIGCTAQRLGGGGFISFSQETYSLECDGDGLNAVGEARVLPSNRFQVQVRLRWETATNPVAIAYGFDANQTLIPNCAAQDTTSGTGWVSDSCNSEVKYVVMYVQAT